MNTSNHVITEFKQLINAGDERINLAYTALYIAKTEYPSLRIADYLKQLDDMASVVDERLKGEMSVLRMIASINDYLFGELGFAGERDSFYDPRNSLFNEVLERKRGIPLSLSLVYMEIGRRLGLPLEGISFPGHFLVRLPVEVGHIVLDPFSGGASLSKHDLKFRLLRRYQVKDDDDEVLSKLMMPASKCDILLRLLNNLKSIYIYEKDYLRALNTTQFILAIRQDDAKEIRDRALLFDKLDCPKAAAEDYHRYLQMEPECEDTEYLRERYIETQRRGRQLH